MRIKVTLQLHNNVIYRNQSVQWLTDLFRNAFGCEQEQAETFARLFWTGNSVKLVLTPNQLGRYVALWGNGKEIKCLSVDLEDHFHDLTNLTPREN